MGRRNFCRSLRSWVWDMIDTVPTCFGIKTRLGMSVRVYFNVFNKNIFLTEYMIRTCDR